MKKIKRPALFLTTGYLFYVIIGWIALSLPWMQASEISGIDTLFSAASAVSTTGLVTVDPGSSYSFWGQLVLLVLIQLGGVGFMTFGSFVVLSLRHKLTATRIDAARSAFSLPEGFSVPYFIRNVILFAGIVETIGTLLLYAIFLTEPSVENPLWAAIFHSVSAFCTAGFSLFPDSLESFRFNPYVTVVIGLLSYLGALGFLVMSDFWAVANDRKKSLFFTTKIILKSTFIIAGSGTILFYALEPSIQEYAPWQKLVLSFFQIMSASTTVGFNTLSINALTPAIIILFYFLMIFGASPSGTGGGLKVTTLAILAAVVKSVLKRRSAVRLEKREVSSGTLNLAVASFIFYMLVVGVAAMLIMVFQPELARKYYSLSAVLFEIISALGTVGLSMGITGALEPLGKLIIILMMFMGRVGILTFGLAISMRDETREEETDNEILI